MFYQLLHYISCYSFKVSERRLKNLYDAKEAQGAWNILEEIQEDLKNQIKLLEKKENENLKK